MPIREIVRRTGVSRNTIKKYLRTGIVEPEFQILDRPSNLDPHAEKLTDWLLSEQRKSRKERRTAKQKHGDLVRAVAFAINFQDVHMGERVQKSLGFLEE
jgi:transcriptional regulator with XRE-family HTH domain